MPAQPTASAAAPRPVAPGTDLIPADLDLVVRIDMALIRGNLGAQSSADLSARAFGHTGPEGIVREALGSAQVVWLAVRVADFHSGDRVMIVRSRTPQVVPDPIAWRQIESANPSLRIFDAIEPPPRDGTARIALLGQRVTVFVSPVELDAVDRVLRVGPDHGRGQPEATGLLSLDWRPRGFSPALVDRFPSLASLIAGVVRVNGRVDVTGGRLVLEGRISCRHARAATKVALFLKTITQTGRQSERYGQLLADLQVKSAENIVRIRWPVPTETVLSLVRDPEPEAPPSSRPDGGLGPPLPSE